MSDANQPNRGVDAESDAAGRRRKQIVTRAARLFDKNGYHNTSMEEIAEAVGLRKPSLYHYVPSKEELLFWIHEEFIDLLLSRYEGRVHENLAPSERLLATMQDIIELLRTHRGHVRVFFEHYRELPRRQQKLIIQKRDAYQTAVEDIIREGIAVGEFRQLDTRLATLALFGMCNWGYQWYRTSGPLSTDEIAKVFWEYLTKGWSETPSVADAPPAIGRDAT